MVWRMYVVVVLVDVDMDQSVSHHRHCNILLTLVGEFIRVFLVAHPRVPWALSACTFATRISTQAVDHYSFSSEEAFPILIVGFIFGR
jgi:hypothetical protein